MANLMKVVRKEGSEEFSYINEEGKFVAPFIFKVAEPFDERTCSAKVRLMNGKWNFLNVEGKLLSSTSFSNILEDDGVHFVVVNEEGKKNIFCPADETCLYDEWQDEVSLDGLK